MDGQDMRMVLQERAIRGGIKTGKAERYPDQGFPHKCADRQPTVMNNRQKQILGNNLNIGTGPDQPLQVLSGRHLFGLLQ